MQEEEEQRQKLRALEAEAARKAAAFFVRQTVVVVEQTRADGFISEALATVLCVHHSIAPLGRRRQHAA